jgi:outer membrane lipoprotein-sorting protein
MSKEPLDRDDDQWLFLPASGRMKRIAKGGKKNYFMGTDFTYEDMEREKLDDFDYTILKEEQFDSQNCYVLEAIPSNERKRRESGYSKRIAWITKDNYLILKIEYYSRQGKLIKTQTSAEWRVAQGTAWRAGKILMDNHRDRHKTSISITKIELNKNIDDQTFTERFILQGRHIR